MKRSGLLPLLLVLLSTIFPCAPAEVDPPGPVPGVALDMADFGRVVWGRNALRLRIRNENGEASSLAVRIRTLFADSGSGMVWEARYPVLLPPHDTGEITLDYFVRPEHGRLRVEVAGEDGNGRKAFEQAKEVLFEAPYRGSYVLQPCRVVRGGVAWEGRILPPFRVRESEHFIFYFLPSSDAEADMEKIVPRREKIFQRLSRELQVTLPEKVLLFFYPDASLAGRITGHQSDGWTYGRTIVEVYGERRKIDPSHELLHLLASRIGSPPVLFSEGLATSREKDFDNAGRYRADVEAWCRGFLREGALIPLSELMQLPSLGDDLTRPRVAYPESACFVRYLLERYGWEKFRKAYAGLVRSADPAVERENLVRFREIYGLDLAESEGLWRQDLSRSRAVGVPPEIVRRVVREERVPYLVARGRELVAAGSLEEAEKCLREAAAQEPGSVEAQFWLGQVLHLRKDFPGALAAYSRVIRLGDRSHLTEVAWSRVWSGQILDLQGRREEALEQYRRAEALQDDSPVLVGGRSTTSREAAQEGIAHPYTASAP